MVLNNVILSTPIVCIVLVIINISIILHGHTMKRKIASSENPLRLDNRAMFPIQSTSIRDERMSGAT